MHPLKFLSSLDAGPMGDHLLEAIRLERRRSTTSKAMSGVVLFGLGALVGGAVLFKVLKMFPPAPGVVVDTKSEAPPEVSKSDRTPDHTRDGVAAQ